MKILSRVFTVMLLWGQFVIPVQAQNLPEPETAFTRADFLRFYTEEEGVVYTDWVDNVKSHMYWKEMTRIGMVPVRNEGRLRDGKSEYRKGFRNPEKAGANAPRISWYCYTGKNQASFDSISDELFLKGYFLVSVQSFQDVNGVQRYQALWVRPDDNPKPKVDMKPLMKDKLKKSILEDLQKRRLNSPPTKMQGFDVPPTEPEEKPDESVNS